jgi:hypothetical protein
MVRLILRADIKLPMKKAMLAVINNGLRPNMSLTFPHDGMNAAVASKYEEPVHAYPEPEIPRLTLMDGRAVNTIVCKR